MTESESIFENLLSERNINFRKIPESSIKTPDYEIIHGGRSYWEIKELTENPNEKSILNQVKNGISDVYSVNSHRVKDSIKKSCQQFIDFGVTKYPCIIVLYDSRDFITKDLLFSKCVKTIMLGKA